MPTKFLKNYFFFRLLLVRFKLHTFLGTIWSSKMADGEKLRANSYLTMALLLQIFYGYFWFLKVHSTSVTHNFMQYVVIIAKYMFIIGLNNCKTPQWLYFKNRNYKIVCSVVGNRLICKLGCPQFRSWLQSWAHQVVFREAILSPTQPSPSAVCG